MANRAAAVQVPNAADSATAPLQRSLLSHEQSLMLLEPSFTSTHSSDADASPQRRRIRAVSVSVEQKKVLILRSQRGGTYRAGQKGGPQVA